MSVVRHEITPLGKIARALKDFGVYSTQYSVEPHRHDLNGQWYLKVTSEGNSSFLMPIGSATLRDTGHHVAALPKAKHDRPEWRLAAAMLMQAAEDGTPVMLAEIAMRRAECR